MVVALVSVASIAQEDYHVIDSTYSRVTYDDDSLYYDDLAYLDRYRFSDNWFIGGGVGLSHSMSENTRFGAFFKNQRPSFSIHVGKYFYPAFGMRVSLGIHPQVGRANWELTELDPNTITDGTPHEYAFHNNYNFNIFSAYFDGLFNFSNIFYKYKESRVFNLIGIIGLGYNHSFGFQKEKLNYWSRGIRYGNNTFKYEVNQEPGNYFAAHVGLQARWKVSNAWDIIAEGTFNGTSDEYNGVSYDRVYDTYVDLLVGAQFHFLDQHGRRRFHYVKHYDEAIIERLAKLVDDETEALNEAYNLMPDIIDKIHLSEALQTTISFYVDRYYITDVQKKNVKAVAKFLETHPDINLIVTGYADVETAYPAYNLRLSQKRSQAVYDMLVNEFNIPENRLRIDYKGDTVQPYNTVNEWNRAVIFFLDRNDGKSQVLESEKKGTIIQK